MIPAPPPGIYEDVHPDVYRSWDAVSASTLRKLRELPPAQVHYDDAQPRKQTPATAFGTLLHALVLEEDTLEERFALAPEMNLRTKADREFWEDFQAEALEAKRTPVRLEAFQEAKAMRDACMRDRVVLDLLTGPGMNEVSVVWIDPVHHLPCKLRADRLVEYRGRLLCLDVKTAHSAAPLAFSRAIEREGYHLAAAWYLRGLEAAGKSAEYRWLAFDKEEPYLPAFYAPDPLDLAQGSDDCTRNLAVIAHCRRTGEWPGYIVDGQAAVCARPRWARRYTEDFADESSPASEEIDF